MVLANLNYLPIPLSSHPAAAFDSWHLSRALSGLSSNDLFYSPGYNSPLFCRARIVLTVCDLNHIDRPENSSLLKRIYYSIILKRSCRKAEHILTISEFSRDRIVQWAGVMPEKVVNISCGVDAAYHPDVAPYDPGFPYLLCVSNRRRHKNEIRTVEAFARANIGVTRLLMTGSVNDELADCVRDNGVEDRVMFLGLVPDDQLPSLYRGARALVFASLYEGFGLPVVEAMACGTPVLTSNTSAIPEIAGNAALLVDPTSVDQIIRGMEQIVSEEPLRIELSKRGILQAAKFSWNQTASKVLAILNAERCLKQ